MAFKTVALFGASGQIGSHILNALLACKTQSFNVIAFTSPNHQLNLEKGTQNVKTNIFDVTSVKREELASALKGVDVIVSALNGKALEAQGLVQDAAADAAVKRFYPSEYGMHHIYRKPGDDRGYIHPMWDLKARCNEYALKHAAINSGEMTYTLIGCGDFYNQDREKTWCPWTQKNVDSYTIHIIGDPDAKIDYTHLDDFAAYLVASICEPKKSENAILNFPSDHISHNEIAALLEKYSKKPVKKELISLDDMHIVVADPSKAPKQLQGGSSFPVDFWFLVKGAQGQGRFYQPKGQNHSHLFPDVERTTFQKYFQIQFGQIDADSPAILEQR